MKKIGEGNTAEIFQLDANRILKLFKPGYSKESMLHEYRNHQIVSELQENVPKLYETVEENGRFGYVMELVQGSKLAELMLNENTFTDAMEQFISVHKAWNKEAQEEIISYKDWMKKVVGNGEEVSEI